MHILLVNHAPIPDFAYGGTERVVWDLGKQLVALGRIPPHAAIPGITLALAANSTTKLVMAFITGGRAYGLRLLPGIAAMVAAFAVVVWFR